jgi:DNA polymerase
MDADWAASTLKWWHDAGVDTIVGETARDWLAADKKVSPALPHGSVTAGQSDRAGSDGPSGGSSAVPSPERQREPLPARLDAFHAWLLDGDLGLSAAATGRVAPAGDPASGLMVLIDMPSAADVAAGNLLSGEPGALFDRMMAAIGRGRDTLYLGSLSPARTATGTLDAAAARRAAEIGRHHVGLVRPTALLLFGDGCAKALLGVAVAQARGKRHELETPAGKISTFVTIRPEKLVSQPGLKKLAWDDLQMLRGRLES